LLSHSRITRNKICSKFEFPIIYITTIAPSGSGKSHGMNVIRDRLFYLEKQNNVKNDESIFINRKYFHVILFSNVQSLFTRKRLKKLLKNKSSLRYKFPCVPNSMKFCGNTFYGLRMFQKYFGNFIINYWPSVFL
jgi:hypothetical protein